MADKIDFASVSYVLGVLSIVFAFFSPLAGLIIGIVGFVQGKKQNAARARKLNLLGIILSVVFLIISIIVLFYAANSGVAGVFPSI